MKNYLILTFLLISCAVYSQSAEEIYQKAYQDLKAGVNAAEVLKTLDNCMKVDRSFEKAYILRAFIYYELGDFDEAIVDYNSLIMVNPRNEEALKNRALSKLQKKDIKGAINDHNLRIQNNPKNAVAYFDRAYCKGLQFDIKGSIADYSKAISLNLEYKEALANRGIAKISMITSKDLADRTLSEMEDACEDLQRAYMLGDEKVLEMLEKYCFSSK